MIGVRDPLGVRPLILGELDGAAILASETCALDIIGARFVRDIKPGEMVVVTPEGIESTFPFAEAKPRFCVFEYVYFARPDSSVEGRGVYEVRKRIGAELAREAPAEADLVVPVPDSGTPAAIGYAAAAGLTFDLGIIRNHYIGRTFIEPSDAIRHMGVRLKHNANRDVLAGKRVVLVDDSIVRGTTSQKIVKMIRDAGAAEVHMRIASPPTMHSCFYGVDTPEESQLIAHRLSIAEMANYIQVDSLAFLSIDGLYRAVGEAQRNADQPQFCDACFTGAYPTRLVDREASNNVHAFPQARRGALAAWSISPAGWRSSPAPRAASVTPRRSASPTPARMWWQWRAPSAASRNSTTRSRRTAAPRRWCRSTSPTTPASIASAPRCISAGARSISCSATLACSAS